MLGFGMDFVHQARPNLPPSITTHLLSTTDLTRASYYLILLGLITAVPAIVTGAAETIKMISKQGLYEADGKTVKNKVKASFAHAAAIDVAMAITAYTWYARRQQLTDSLAGKLGLESAAPFAPATWMVAAEVVAFMVMGMGANIGGTLTYNFGVGFSAMSSGNKKKQ